MKTELFTIVAAAGKGTRLGEEINKAFVEIEGLPLVIHTLKSLNACLDCQDIAVVVAANEVSYAEKIITEYEKLFTRLNITIVAGGKERQDSVYNALLQVPEEFTYVAVHDAARAFFSPELFNKVFLMAKEKTAAIAAVKATDTIKLMRNGLIEVTLDRNHVFLAQTPQIFLKDILSKAYEKAMKEGYVATDDASIVEKFGARVAIVEGEYTNIKVTHKEDLMKLKILLGECQYEL